MKKMKNRVIIIIPLATFLFGFFPTLLLCIRGSVFITKTVVMLPLIYNVSVMLGDSILLPLINYLLFRMIIQIWPAIKMDKKWIFSFAAIVIVLSFIGNYQIHEIWKNDSITDFIAFTPGKYSFVGLWHLVFSTLETSVLAVFPFLWFLCIKHKQIKYYKNIHKIWLIIFVFTTLGFFDMLNKYLFIFTDKSFLEVLLIDRFAFVTPTIALIIRFTFKYIERKSYNLK
jgi:hypothetical protein